MRKTILLVLLTVWQCLIPFLYAQQVSLTEILALKRLPVNAIHRIFQDSEGYIWYGTVNGLCRDDGYRIQVFRSDFNHRGLLSNNLIECITEDVNGRIWFGTDKGVYILDKKDYTIRPLDHEQLNGRIISQLYATSDGNIWVSIHGTLFRFGSDGICRKTYPIRNGNVPTTLAGFCESRNKEIIITLSQGTVYRLDRTKDRFSPFPDNMRHHNPGTLIQDKDHDYYWMCTWGDGLVRFDPKAEKDSMFVYQASKTDADKNLMYIALDKTHNRLWLTSTTHLVAFDVRNGKAMQISCDDIQQGHTMLNEIIKGSNGDLWVAAFDRPGFILHNSMERIQTFSLPALQHLCNYRPAVMALCDSGESIVWMFQEREGIFLYDLHHDRTTCHKQFASTSRLPFGMVKLIAESRTQGAAWIAPEFKLQAYRLGRNDMAMYAIDSADFSTCAQPGDIMASLYEDRQGRYLYSGTTKGLFRHDLRTKKTTTVCDTLGHVTDIIESEDHTLYICTYDKGVYALSPNNGMQHYRLPQAFSCLTRTTDGTLWLGSDEGDLISLNPHDGSTQNYNKICQLNGDMINRIIADDFNHIWIDTNQKIIEFNPHNRSYRTYLTTDGSAGLWRLIPTALCKGKDGNLYFGGISGISRFTPSNTLEREAAPAHVTITDLRTSDFSLFFDMNRTYEKDGSIRITAEEKNLTIRFSSLHHRIAHKIRYAYRMKGIDEEWQYISGQTAEAVYSHLPKGEYDFEVKATDENGQWSRSVTTLRIHRLPAWYETWWAYLIYISIIAGGTTYGIYRYIHRIKQRNDELWADSAEMLQMRNYLNMTHEEENCESESLSKLLMEKAIRIVEKNLAEPDFDVQRLAEGMNMSRSTLTRKLKSISGDTPLDFIRHIKMKHACRMLKDKQMNVSEVATALGYFNRKYFTNCFKEEFGMTPSEYQKANV